MTSLKTTHRIITADSRDLAAIPSESVDLVVTSPPYPMIGMWDPLFSGMSGEIGQALSANDGETAFELMHRELDKAWAELRRVLKDGSFACINIGDATRSVAGRFRLFSNHTRITAAFSSLGFDCLPLILWRKTINAPTKFMGSGMLPPAAYVTLEHEYILIFRKQGKRGFTSAAEHRRRLESAYFWEERNRWFVDTWDIPGNPQELGAPDLRQRSAAYPPELAFRLINMYSLQADTVLDPFAGTGTTSVAAIAAARNSVGVEIDGTFRPVIAGRIGSALQPASVFATARVRDHIEFVKARTEAGKGLKYVNTAHGFPVVTMQERGIRLRRPSRLSDGGDGVFFAEYEDIGEVPGVILE